MEEQYEREIARLERYIWLDKLEQKNSSLKKQLAEYEKREAFREYMNGENL